MRTLWVLPRAVAFCGILVRRMLSAGARSLAPLATVSLVIVSLVMVSLATVSCAGPKLRPPAPDDALRVDGLVEKGPFGFTAAELGKLERRAVRGVDPHAGPEASYEGVALAPLLTEGLPLQRGAELAIFHGRGGYQAAVPLNAIRQSQPVLADVGGGRKLAEARPESGPLLLAWPDAEAPGLDTDPRHRWFWVRGVTRIEIASQEAMARAVRVPLGASSEARLGASTYAQQCIHCHRLRGRGGTAGPELTGYLGGREPASLVAVLQSHLGPRAGIPGAPELSPAAAMQVAAFLRAVAQSGPERPEDEVKPPPPPRPPTAVPPGGPASRP